MLARFRERDSKRLYVCTFVPLFMSLTSENFLLVFVVTFHLVIISRAAQRLGENTCVCPKQNLTCILARFRERKPQETLCVTVRMFLCSGHWCLS